MKNCNNSFFKQSILLFTVLGLLFTFTMQSKAQVSIAPTSLFFTPQSRFATLTVSNGGQQPQEVSITTEFGFPTSKDGNLYIASDSSLAQQKSIADWIRAFPKNFTLQPNQRQMVRFLVRPSEKLDPGGYWSRVQISSAAASAPIDSVNQNQVGAQINLVVNQIIAAHYRTTGAKTSVKVDSINFTQTDSTHQGVVAVSMEETGNAPFIGSIQFSILNDNGQSVYDAATTTSVYTTITRTFNVNLTDIEPGNYTISGTVESERSDISQDKLLQITPVSFSKKITIE